MGPTGRRLEHGTDCISEKVRWQNDKRNSIRVPDRLEGGEGCRVERDGGGGGGGCLRGGVGGGVGGGRGFPNKRCIDSHCRILSPRDTVV
jgi:hypothetical protein